MGRGNDAYRGSSNNKLLAAVNMAECEAHMSNDLSQSNRFINGFHAKILHVIFVLTFLNSVCAAAHTLLFPLSYF